jgi:hypothetical protein
VQSYFLILIVSQAAGAAASTMLLSVSMRACSTLAALALPAG